MKEKLLNQINLESITHENYFLLEQLYANFELNADLMMRHYEKKKYIKWKYVQVNLF